MKLFVCTALLFFASACATAQRPVSFKTTRSVARSVSTAASELTRHGMQAAHIDAEAGLIRTAWRDTGLRSGKIAGVPATFVQRYTIRIERENRWQSVSVTHDRRRCMAGVDVIEGSRACEDASVRLGHDQAELSEIAELIERAVKRRAPVDATKLTAFAGDR